MKLLLLKQYKKKYYNQSKSNDWLRNGINKIYEFYSHYDFTLVIDKSSKLDHPIFSNSSNNLFGGIIYVDPIKAFKEDYKDPTLETIARTHCKNIKKSNLKKHEKLYLDFVLGVCHEVGHLKKQHGVYNDHNRYWEDTQYRQMIEIEAEEEVLQKAQFILINGKIALDIIEPI
jgi:hypothetical protein